MTSQPLSKSIFLKCCFLWTPILLWYFAGFFFSHSYAFFHQVDIFYYNAGQAWLHKNALYNGQANSFVYLPTSAALFSPLSLLPLKLFEMVFRLLSLGVITLGIFLFVRDTAKENASRIFFYSLLATVLTSQAALFVGQLHILTTGIMLLGFSAIAREKWWQAAILLTLALALKPTSLILFLLAFALYPKQLSLRLTFCALLAFGLSFVLQSPDYVLNQYISFAHNFAAAMRHDGNNPQQWATLFGAIAFYTHHFIQGFPQFLTRVLAGLCVFALCITARIKCDKQTAIYFIVTFGMCYLMLFNSRSENNDYVMVAPLIGYALSLAILQKKQSAVCAISLGIILIAFSWNISKLITPGHNIWINPTVVLLFSFYAVYALIGCTTFTRT